METKNKSVIFGEDTFNFDTMKEHLPGKFYEKLEYAIKNGTTISNQTADVVALAMKKWAVQKGATHYTHWFQPLSGVTAEKHDSFLNMDSKGNIIYKFSGRELIMSEPDASSFPHGGLRSTFEARGYAAWDPTSPAFLMRSKNNATLCLPSVYVSYKGEVLDKKTPLIRSTHVVNKASVRMLQLLGDKKVKSVMPYVGAEQEYFLVDAEIIKKRPDLLEVGATLLGCGPSRGQQLEDHYFRSIDERVLNFMEDVDVALTRLGVPLKTRHNEVAPSQFEFASLHSPANIAADQNQLLMKTIKCTAQRHNMVALLHEKPFARLNGSGKHNNWSLISSEGTNLFEWKDSKSSRLRFLIFLMSVTWGVKRHGDLLAGIIASAGNDLRLGGHEAPPGIMSVFLGSYLNDLLENIQKKDFRRSRHMDEIDLKLGGVSKIPKDATDRNRTAPIAFTGNKFEFRAVGSSAAISLTNVVINTIVAESLTLMCDIFEKKQKDGMSRTAAAMEMLKDVIRESKSCLFDGDCYGDEWQKKASKMGLKAPVNTPQAIKALVSDSTFKLFDEFGILSNKELRARYFIKLDLYVKTVSVELAIAKQMLSTKVLPSAIKFQKRLATAVNSVCSVPGMSDKSVKNETEYLKKLTVLIEDLLKANSKLLKDENILLKKTKLEDRAFFCAEKVRSDIAKARKISDELETIIDADIWMMPGYDDLLRL